MSLVEKEIISWFEENKRDLPWRNTTPWGVMVSEFMLQQTPVSRVLPRWIEWMQRWPTAQDLASASTSEVITAWGRLGYPRRALRLHECAKIIAAEFANEVPRNEEFLRSLPGIGEYTAAAIIAFAYEEESLVLDINIRRLFARLYDGVESAPSSPSKVERARRKELIPKANAHTWAAATMELGALVCTARNPQCAQCPVKKMCAWRKSDFPKSEILKKSQTWKGSDRQCRGNIVQSLRENESLTEKQLKKLWHDDSQIEKALTSLIADGLIQKQPRNSYSLPS